MEPKGFHRKLTAILSADVAGYSRLMQDDEAATVTTLESYKQAFFDLIKQHRGRVVDSPGDNLLAEFASVVDAVQCAVAAQKEFQARNTELPENRKMQFRIGVNLGDVIEEESRIYGDGVNIAARLEALADPGGICVSKTAFDHIESKLPFGYAYLGEQTVKNIAKPVGAFKVLMEPRVTTTAELDADSKPRTTRSRKIAFACAAALLVALGAAATWQFTPHKAQPPADKTDLRTAVFPPADKPSLAVLPFQNMTGDPQQEYFCEGMAEQLITGLSQGPYLFVTARTSSFGFKGKSMTAKQIAAELGVRYLLEGSVQRDAERVRVNVQLIDGRNGNHVWAERYDSKFEDLFALQDQITMGVMAFLNLEITGFTSGGLKIVRPKNLKAYEYYLKGLYLHLGRRPQDVLPARQACEEALNHDPSFAAAYRLLGLVYMDEIVFGMTKTPEKVFEQAEQAAQQALAADPDYPPNVLWSQICRVKKDSDNAISYAEKAIKQGPNNAYHYFFLGLALFLGERFEDAIRAFETGLQLVPFRPANYILQLAWSFVGNKQYDKAIPLFNEVLEKTSVRGYEFSSYKGLTAAYELSGNHEKASWAAENILRLNPKFSLVADEKASTAKDGIFKTTMFDAYRSAGLK
jgi:adenylate cyclase